MNQDPPTYWVLFLSCDVVPEYISIKIVYFHLKCYGQFLYSKRNSGMITVSQNVPWVCDVV